MMLRRTVNFTKTIQFEFFCAFPRAWDIIPIFNIDWQWVPKHLDHTGMYFTFAIYRFQLEFNIYSTLHVEDKSDESDC